MATIVASKAGDGLLVRVLDAQGVAISRGAVLQCWREDVFADAFSTALAGVAFPAFFWETPAWQAAALDLPFESMATPSAALANASADRAPFAAHLAQGVGVVTTRNLGGDAELVIPGDPGGDGYAHFATFLRTAGVEQKRLLWRTIADTADTWLADDPARPFWLSAAGLGVAWLHVRFDTRPKYYVHKPYCAV